MSFVLLGSIKCYVLPAIGHVLPGTRYRALCDQIDHLIDHRQPTNAGTFEGR